MSRDRPKRTRKIVNYGEDHLHWIEEAQLQKAFLRSLHDKDSPHKHSAKIKMSSGIDQATTENSCGLLSNKKIIVPASEADSPTSVSKNTMQSSKVILENIDDEVKNDSGTNNDTHSASVSTKNESMQLSSTNMNSKLFATDSCELRLTRLQSKLLEEAGMFYPDAEVVMASCHNKVNEKDTVMVPEEKETLSHLSPAKSNLSDNDDGSLTPRVRAQRKFASNTSPPQTRSNSPVKMHRRKVLFTDVNRKRNIPSKEKNVVRGRAVRACSSENEKSEIVLIDNVQKKKKCADGCSRTGHKNTPTSVFEGMPKTDNFLSFLCFRNTTLKVELQDCVD